MNGAARPRSSEPDKSRRDSAIERLVAGVKKGRPVVPLVGAGISVEAGVPSLSEVTRYLAKTKAYLRYRVYENRPPTEELKPRFRRRGESRWEAPPPFGMQPRDYLREFGWPDPNELSSSLWHWGWRTDSSSATAGDFQSFMNDLVNAEILESLGRIDQTFPENVWEIMLKAEKEGKRWDLSGSYWKILLTQLTRSSPDLVDTLFQRLARNREPSTAHRHFAFLTPVLRLRLFLTINFDTLLEDALRIEGFRPTVYEVADGLSLPHPKLVQEGLSVVKLHGGAYGLLVGDKLDSPLDEETRSRFRAYLPEHLILLVMGIGGWDQRVLDMVDLARERQGEVLWLHFEPDIPAPLLERFTKTPERDWLHAARVQDPGAFLREVYSRFKLSHPSSSRPFQVCDLRPVLIDFQVEQKKRKAERHPWVKVFVDHEKDFGLGAAWKLSEFVSKQSGTHLPVWIDMEFKFTVEDVLVDLIQQLRRYDPGLPPEILVIERAADQGREYRKVVRRLYAALARGRYILAFNGLCSFGRWPTRHHREEEAPLTGGGQNSLDLRDKPEDLVAFLSELIDCVQIRNPSEPRENDLPESLGLLDSILAFALEWSPESVVRPELLNVFSVPTESGDGHPVHWKEAAFTRLTEPGAWEAHPHLAILVAIRRRRSIVGLHKLLAKYLPLPLEVKLKQAQKEEQRRELDRKLREARGRKAIEAELDRLEKEAYLWRLEGGDYWMSRRLRNDLYKKLRGIATSSMENEPKIQVLSLLAFVHQDLAEYYHRDVYVGSQDVGSLLEEIYHRIAALRYLRKLEEAADPAFEVRGPLTIWLEVLARPVSKVKLDLSCDDVLGKGVWTGSIPIVSNRRIDPVSLAQRRFRGLRALREVIDQERDALLSRVPGLTLQGWVHAIASDIPEIVECDKKATGQDEWRKELGKEGERLAELLMDLRSEILQDRMKDQRLIELRRAEWKDIRSKERQERKDIRKKKRQNNKRAGRGFTQPDWVCIRRYAGILTDIAYAQTRAPVNPKHTRRSNYSRWLNKFLEAFLRERCGDTSRAGSIPKRPIPVALLDLKVQYLRLLADQALWGQSPWETKGKGYKALESQTKAADKALCFCEEALQIMDAIREEDRTLRSYLYSLRGRALYLKGEYDPAYREFDLARAGFYATSPKEHEILAVTLLRRAECLMVHSDDELSNWVVAMVEGGIFEKRPVEWRRLLSSEGRRKWAPTPTEEAARELIRLSLANCSPEVLSVLEGRVRAIGEQSRALKDTLGTVRSRLAAARELLDRVETLLESSRSKVEWWACLFQLRTQLAIERLLLLLSGDYAPVSTSQEREEPQTPALSNLEREDPWYSVRLWLQQRESSQRERFPTGWKDLLRSVPDPLATEGELRRRFIHRFQGTLRGGVMAVRQGLDILLPNDAGREEERLMHDPLLIRQLRSWTELMICGAYATEMSLGIRPEHRLDDNVREPIQRELGPERWDQWRYLNWLSGLKTLLEEGKDESQSLRTWFLERDWRIGPPSLASRARILARMDLCLIRPQTIEPESPEAEELRFPGGNAVSLLCQALGRGSSR